MNKQQEELAMRLDLLMPMKWMSDNYPNVEHIFSKMVELNQEWVKEVVNNASHRLTDVLHDFSGIYGNFACPPEEKDEHFLPRISSDILYSVGDKVSVLMRGSKADGHQDAIITSINTEDGVLRKTSKRNTLLSVNAIDEDLSDEVSTYDIRFYGFTAIQEKELALEGAFARSISYATKLKN